MPNNQLIIRTFQWASIFLILMLIYLVTHLQTIPVGHPGFNTSSGIQYHYDSTGNVKSIEQHNPWKDVILID